MSCQITELQRLINLAHEGKGSDWWDVVKHMLDELRKRTHDKKAGFPGLRCRESTEDVLHNVCIRLSRALGQVNPRDARHVYGLAGQQIRRELVDRYRHYFGRGPSRRKQPVNDGGPGSGAHVEDAVDPRSEPARATKLKELYEEIDRLPAEQREVIDLLYFGRMTQAEAAEVLEVPLSTVKGRLLRAKDALSRAFHGEPPGLR